MPTEFLNRAVKNSDGSYVYWMTVGLPDPSFTSSGAPSPSDDYNSPVVIARRPARPEILQENLSSQVSGSVATFTTSQPYRSGTLSVRWNGQIQSLSEVTEASSNTFSMALTPESGDAIEVEYRPA